MESLDTSIGTIEDTERLLGTPVLGVIPHIDLQQARDRLPPDLFPAQAKEEDL
jgi:hypothetical protein